MLRSAPSSLVEKLIMALSRVQVRIDLFLYNMQLRWNDGAIKSHMTVRCGNFEKHINKYYDIVIKILHIEKG